MYKKTITAVVCVILISLLFLTGRYFYKLSKYKQVVADIAIEAPNLSNISDGTYNGAFDAAMISADVSVTIRSHRITEIKINEHKTDKGQQAERITDDVLSAQSLNVDTISGATNSSKVILKAIELALKEGEQGG
ncbi:MAG: FMN-binding protein [Christensenellaceae bacterium]|jgi:uncharacterized protein with FMN-binding domain|nr:FMN-binding protein [Christensenellaceae bacterium]